MTIDIIIPLYKPGKELFALLDRLSEQSVQAENIILVNTEEKYFAQLTYGTRFFDKYKNVKVYHLSKKEFDHGRTRRMGVGKSNADIFVMMTQDAIPADNLMLERLTGQLKGDVAVAYARQLPAEDCDIVERYTRSFNYPEESRVKSAEDLPLLGIKTFFCSNVCAAYQRTIYEELGGFVRKTIFNEDMIYAAGAIKEGYRIAYEAQACVIHSHNYTHMQQLHRNFDLGVSQAEHPEIFANVPSESEGMRMVKEVTRYLKKQKQLGKLPHFYVQCFCKYAGFLLGKNYCKLPGKWVLALTSNKDYWQK